MEDGKLEQYAVLMAVYYKEQPEYLRMAVESMLQQTVPPEEFVLVCDGPLTKELDGVISEFCAARPELFRIHRLKENQGLGTALNEGLTQCRCELVARLDSDDLAVPERMQLQLEAMAHNPHISVLGGQIGEFSQSPEKIVALRLVPTENTAIREFATYRSPMNHTTVLFRKSHVLQVGGYEAVAGFEDYMLWGKLLADGKILANLPQVCCKVRADDGMYSRRGGMDYFCHAVQMERLLLRRKLISPVQYFRNIGIRFAGTVLLNNRVRRVVFLRFLRKPPQEVFADMSCRKAV